MAAAWFTAAAEAGKKSTAQRTFLIRFTVSSPQSIKVALEVPMAATDGANRLVDRLLRTNERWKRVGPELNRTALLIYFLAVPGWLIVWHALVGWEWLLRYRLLLVAFGGALFVFLANIALAFAAATPSYDTELGVYSYVENNAKTVAEFSLAIAIFVLVQFDKKTAVIEPRAARKFLSLIFWSFLFAVVGCLPLYWMPPVASWLITLRHLKTVPFTYSLFILASAIVIFIRETNKDHQP
jgi:hypothetical protein